MWTFRPADVCRLTGTALPQLEHLIGLGIIEPLHRAPMSGSPRLYSLRNVFEVALARELLAVGINGKRLQTVFAALRANVATVPESLRASATCVKYCEMVKAIATILGQTNDPAYRAWGRDADRLLRSWYRNRAQLDWQVLTLLAGRSNTDESSNLTAS